MRYPCVLLFGAPGSGKGTQGKILARIPGFVHCACGDVFRSLDLNSDLGRIFYDYSSRGELVPDEVTVALWHEWLDATVLTHQFDPTSQYLVLDGIPRNVAQARLMEDHIEVRRIVHLICRDQQQLYHRMKRRALHENRYDDASDRTIQQRLEVYEHETRRVLDYYPRDILVEVDGSQTPIRVLQDILAILPDPESPSSAEPPLPALDQIQR
jgi:adenylate kinase